MEFDNSYARLPGNFYQRINPTKVLQPKLIRFNYPQAEELGIDLKDENLLAQIFSGNQILEGAEPLAQAYAGHQFGHFVAQLGDGRAILLGELIDKQGKRKDLQLKGSGRTAYSRSGDGRAWLGPVIREYIVSEAMHSLGVPTSRALAAVTTGEMIYREQKLPGAILTRVSSSHIRIGTFEFFYDDLESLKILADYSILRHYPENLTDTNPYAAFLASVLEKQIELIVKWMSVGFVHGVMNTDNTSISGETIDYGPCAFIDTYNPSAVFSSIDHYGRYAYDKQPNIALWNLSCLAEVLAPLINAPERIQETLDSFKTKFEQKFTEAFTAKLGLEKQSETDLSLLYELLILMQSYRADFTLSFRYLANLLEERDEQKFFGLFDSAAKASLNEWFNKWRSRLVQEEVSEEIITGRIKRNNPLFIPRNHKIEQAIQSATKSQDFSDMSMMIESLYYPFAESDSELLLAPESSNQDYVTFCGT